VEEASPVGSWDDGPFDNDDAVVLVSSLMDAELGRRVGMVSAEFESVLRDGEYLEVDEGNMVVAAAALVAGSVSDEFLLRGGPIVPLPTPTADVITLAVRALERIIGAQSEWRDLWGEGDAVQGVRDLIATLQAR
jgi:hypothetical protein